MEYVYIKDSEGYVQKKLKTELQQNDTIISETEYKKKSGLSFYEKTFTHGGVRKNAGRKQKYKQALKYQMRVTEEEKEFISYVREHHIDYKTLLKK
ncbi:MAG TPA: hypothetical protein PKW26_07525 [Treponemataceae bacterium]|jgi:hypothetical protein|nr:hypothetical protein [Treponemataceae bacterium]HPM06251.1 hypothetical protein [Treponemataceae bacterium]